MDEVLERLDFCITLAKRLASQVSQDSMEMETCTRGQLLTEYRSAMDQATYRLNSIITELAYIYSDHCLQ